MLEKDFLKFIKIVKFPIALFLLLWAVHIYKFYSGALLTQFGVFPRAMDGVIGIFTAPLIHSDFSHILSNSIPMLLLTTALFVFYSRIASFSFGLIYILSGISVWLFAREVYHVGASGVVYGLVALVFWLGVLRRNVKSIVLSLIVVMLYSGYINGILPNQEGISWESHLFGGIVGMFVAYLLKDVQEPDELTIYDPWQTEDLTTKHYYLPRDTFSMTKEERSHLETQSYWHIDHT